MKTAPTPTTSPATRATTRHGAEGHRAQGAAAPATPTHAPRVGTLVLAWEIAAGLLPGGAHARARLVVRITDERITAEVLLGPPARPARDPACTAALAKALAGDTPAWTFDLRSAVAHLRTNTVELSLRVSPDAGAPPTLLYARTTLLATLGVGGGRFGRPELSRTP